MKLRRPRTLAPMIEVGVYQCGACGLVVGGDDAWAVSLERAEHESRCGPMHPAVVWR